MESNTSSTSLGTIIIIVLFVLALALFFGVLITFAQKNQPEVLVTNIPLVNTFTLAPSQTSSATSTTTLTPRPTWTLRPSSTSTHTPTPTPTQTSTLIRTVTPATPARFNDRYELKPWNLNEQQRMIELLKANVILSGSPDSYRTLAYAEGEALIRFPGAEDAIHWKWDRPYNLIHVGDPTALSIYANLIQSALSAKQVRSSDLALWFAQFETRLRLQLFSFPPQSGELARGLIELKAIDGQGSAFLWMVESPSGAAVYPLINDIDFTLTHQNSFIYEELTGEGSPELILYRPTSPGNTSQILPVIFDVTGQPVLELSIQQHEPIDFGLEPRAEVRILPDSNGNPSLVVTNLLLPSCPVYATQQLNWDGTQFVLSPINYTLTPVEGLEANCELIINTAAEQWDPDIAIAVLLPILDIWPPALDINGRPFPPNAKDELRYRIAVLYALTGDSDKANQYFTDIITSPTTPNSKWSSLADHFMTTLTSTEDIYIACQQSDLCNMRAALKLLVKQSEAADIPQLIRYMQAHGVVIRSNAPFDFDGDGQDERWVIIQPRSENKLEFWILSHTSTGVEATFVKVFEASDSLPFLHEPTGAVPVIQFELHKGFIFERLPGSRRAFIRWVDVVYARPTTILDNYRVALSALMNGADPGEIKSDLLELFNSPRFKGDCIAYNICDQFHYTLALVYDLLTEEGNAIDEYLWVWRNYGKSPYALLARLKLDYFPLPTYTMTPAPSSTPFPTRTVTPTRTSTATPTQTTTP